MGKLIINLFGFKNNLDLRIIFIIKNYLKKLKNIILN